MGDEWPIIPFPCDWEEEGTEGELEAGMVICIESFIGSEHGGEGVKLEQQVLVTETGCEVMSAFPFESDLL
jgi:Xaa-Pro aminopeptidase